MNNTSDFKEGGLAVLADRTGLFLPYSIASIITVGEIRRLQEIEKLTKDLVDTKKDGTLILKKNHGKLTLKENE